MQHYYLEIRTIVRVTLEKLQKSTKMGQCTKVLFCDHLRLYHKRVVAVDDAFLWWLQGKLVYANQGKPSDYQLLNQTIDLRGTVAITRYGGAGRAAKVSCTHPELIMHYYQKIGSSGETKLLCQNVAMSVNSSTLFYLASKSFGGQTCHNVNSLLSKTN